MVPECEEEEVGGSCTAIAIAGNVIVTLIKVKERDQKDYHFLHC